MRYFAWPYLGQTHTLLVVRFAASLAPVWSAALIRIGFSDRDRILARFRHFRPAKQDRRFESTLLHRPVVARCVLLGGVRLSDSGGRSW